MCAQLQENCRLGVAVVSVIMSPRRRYFNAKSYVYISREARKWSYVCEINRFDCANCIYDSLSLDIKRIKGVNIVNIKEVNIQDCTLLRCH